jgi:hypothetical protein
VGDGAADGTSEGEAGVEGESLELLGLGDLNLSGSHCDGGSRSSEQTLSGEERESLVRVERSDVERCEVYLGRAVMKSSGFCLRSFSLLCSLPAGEALV